MDISMTDGDLLKLIWNMKIVILKQIILLSDWKNTKAILS